MLNQKILFFWKKSQNKIIVLTFIIICLAGFTFLSLARFSYVSGQESKLKRVTDLPEVNLEVKSLEVVKSKIERRGTNTAIAIIEIKNKTDKPIIAIAIESGDEENATGVIYHYFRNGEDNPKVLIEPNKTFKVEMSLSNLKPGFPIRISSVMYADESVEGNELTIIQTRKEKEHFKLKRIGGLKPQ